MMRDSQSLAPSFCGTTLVTFSSSWHHRSNSFSSRDMMSGGSMTESTAHLQNVRTERSEKMIRERERERKDTIEFGSLSGILIAAGYRKLRERPRAPRHLRYDQQPRRQRGQLWEQRRSNSAVGEGGEEGEDA
jgi:hypothetical protein